MIKDTRRGIVPGSMMTSKESFDSFYTRKLEAFAVQLREIVFDTVYAVGNSKACPVCGCRVFHRGQQMTLGRCVLCFPTWLNARSELQCDALLSRYPQMEECAAEWEARQGIKVPQPEPEKKAKTTTKIIEPKQPEPECVAYGQRLREARKKIKMSQGDLAEKIIQKSGKKLSPQALQLYEYGQQVTPKHIRGQLERILGLEETQG